MALLPYSGRRVTALDCGIVIYATWLVIKYMRSAWLRSRTTRLRGPKSKSLVFGVSKVLSDGDRSEYFEIWEREFGKAYQIPTTLGTRQTVIFDPKAIAHFYSKDSYGYRMHPVIRQATKDFVGLFFSLCAHI